MEDPLSFTTRTISSNNNQKIQRDQMLAKKSQYRWRYRLMVFCKDRPCVHLPLHHQQYRQQVSLGYNPQ